MDTKSRNEVDSNIDKKENDVMLESDDESTGKDEKISLDSAETFPTGGVDSIDNRNVSTRQKIRVYCSEIPWFQVSLLVTIHVILGVQYYLFPILYDDLIRGMNATTAEVGWVASIQLFVSLATGIFFSGPLRQHGNRKVTAVGGLIVFVSMAASSLSPNLYVMYLTYGVLTGLGLASLYMVLNVVPQQQFSKHRTMLTMIVFSGYSLGQFICPALTYALLEHYSWRGTMLILSAVMANVIPIGMLFPDEPTSADEQEQTTESGKANSFIANLKEIFDFSFLKDIPFLLYHLTTIFVRIATMGSFFHIPNFLVSRGVPKEKRTLFLTIQSAVSFTVRLLLGVVSESRYVDRKVLHGIGAAMVAVAAFILPTSNGPAGIVAALIAFGMHLVCWGALVPVVLVDLMGVENIARSSAINFCFFGTVSLVAPPFAGWIYDITQDYNIPFYVNAGIGAVGFCLYIATYITLKRRTQTQAKQLKPPQPFSQLEQMDLHGSSLLAMPVSDSHPG